MMKNDLTSLRKGAVVSCYFPLTETPRTPGPIARPALVVQVFFDTVDQTWKVVVAYGTSRRSRANMGYELRMTQEEGLKNAGLTTPTRFTLSRMRILPFNERFFDFSRDGGPITGHVDAGLIERLDKTCEILAGVAKPLEPLARCSGANVNIANQRQSADGARHAVNRTDSQAMDAFMVRYMTGNARLKGARKRA